MGILKWNFLTNTFFITHSTTRNTYSIANTGNKYSWAFCNFTSLHVAITMSQKSHKVFSRKSEPKEPTDEELKREIFANLPFEVFRDFTNVISLISDKYRRLQDGKGPKGPTTFYVNRKVEEHYKNLSKTDVHDALLEDLNFIGSKSAAE